MCVVYIMNGSFLLELQPPPPLPIGREQTQGIRYIDIQCYKRQI